MIYLNIFVYVGYNYILILLFNNKYHAHAVLFDHAMPCKDIKCQNIKLHAKKCNETSGKCIIILDEKRSRNVNLK